MYTREDLVEFTNLVRESIVILNEQRQILQYLSGTFSGTKTDDDKIALGSIMNNISEKMKKVSENCSTICSKIASEKIPTPYQNINDMESE